LIKNVTYNGYTHIQMNDKKTTEQTIKNLLFLVCNSKARDAHNGYDDEIFEKITDVVISINHSTTICYDDKIELYKIILGVFPAYIEDIALEYHSSVNILDN